MRTELEKNFPKYDILLKDSFSFRGSGLRHLLGVPDGQPLLEELKGLSRLRVDTLTEKGGCYYHVEFQSRNDASMQWRMLGYYMGIIEKHLGNALYTGERRLSQTVIYVGRDEIDMIAGVKQDDLDFTFELRDIRDFTAQSATLHKSDNPLDWIVGVLCNRNPNLQQWQETVNRLKRLRRRDDWEQRETSAMFLIACLLRNLPRQTVKEWEAMLEINVENSDVFKKVYDQATVASYRRIIAAKLERRPAARSGAGETQRVR